MIWSLAPAVMIVFGINLTDRTYVRHIILVPSMVQCQMAKPTILAAMKQRFGKDLPSIHLSARCAVRATARRKEPRSLWQDT